MRYLYLLILVVLLSVFLCANAFFGNVLVFAQDNHPVDKSIDDCLSNSKFITSEMVECFKEGYVKWKAEIEKYYNLLMDVLDKESKEQLQKSQSAWEKYRDAEFEFIPNYYQDIGSYQGPTTWGHKVDLLQDRAMQLISYYETVTDK